MSDKSSDEPVCSFCEKGDHDDCDSRRLSGRCCCGAQAGGESVKGELVDVEPPVQSPAQVATTTVVRELDLPHDSAYIYSQVKRKHYELVSPSLKEKEKSTKQWIGIGLLMFVILMGSWGTAYEIQYHLLNPPKVYQGNCAPPLVIRSGNCYQVQLTTDAQGHEVTTYIPAGTVNLNGK